MQTRSKGRLDGEEIQADEAAEVLPNQVYFTFLNEFGLQLSTSLPVCMFR